MVRRVKTKHIEEIEAAVEAAEAEESVESVAAVEEEQPILPGLEEAVAVPEIPVDNGARVKWVDGSPIFHILGGANVPTSIVKQAVSWLKTPDDTEESGPVKSVLMTDLQTAAVGQGCSAFDALLVARLILRGDFDNHAGIEAYK